jgi:predicted permease
MALLRRLIGGLNALARKHRVEQELDEELRAYLETSIEEKMRAGLNQEDATRAASREVGSTEAVKDWVRDVGWESTAEGVWQDVRYAGRTLRKSPGFATAVTLSLALGISANTAIFTLMDAVMWRMLPVSDPESLLTLGRQQRETVQTGFTYGEFRLMRENSGVVELAGYTTAPISVSVVGPLEPSVQGQLVTGDYFSLLGVNPLLGRTIGPDDDRVPNGHPVAMLSHGYWDRRFARSPLVIGRTLRLSGAPFTIIGVTPPEFFGVETGIAPDLFLPMMMQPTVMPAFENLLEEPIVSRTWVHTLARTKPGITPDHAASALDSLLRGQEAAPRSTVSGAGAPVRVVLSPATAVSVLRRQFSQPLLVLLAMVGVVLLIACANAANLLLARAAARRPELAMRLALGASRPRVIRQLIVESLLLATISGACGVVLARWATRLLLAFLSSGRTPLVLDVTPNLRILAFTVAVSALTGLLFGLAPAWRGTRIDLGPALRNVRGSLTRGARPGRSLVVAQLALSLLLLVGTGLFVRSLQKLNADGGVGLREHVVTLRVEPRGSDQRGVPGTSERLDRIYQELIRRTEEIAGVEAASMANSTPTAPTSSAAVPILTASGDVVRVPALMIYPQYFRTIGIPIIAGRDFGSADLGEHARAVCIVNESFVRQFLPAEDPIGKPCHRGRRSRLLRFAAHPETPLPEEAFVIVGVVKDSRYSNPRGDVQPVIYRTFLQSSTGRGQMVLHVRVNGNRGEVVQRIREQVAALDATVPVFDVRTLQEEMNAALVQQRLVAMLSTSFGALALALAAVGLYGLLAFMVVERKSELGIRMALGARRGDVLWLVVREALLLVAIGTAVGVPAALGLARLASAQISGFMFGVEATDPATIAIAAFTLASVAAFAAYLPARRASRIDPLVALRAE